MVAKRIIPCLDINGGRVVKGVNFLNLKDAGDPIEVAKVYDKSGADELHRISVILFWKSVGCCGYRCKKKP